MPPRRTRNGVLVTPTLLLIEPRPRVTLLGSLNDERPGPRRAAAGPVTHVRQHRRSSRQGAEALAHALRTHQVDAIVGERQLMLVRVKQAEDDLERSRDELRALAAELQSVREEERTAIAREIHDELGQTLTSLQLGLAWIAAKVVPSRQRPLQAKVTALAALVTSLIRSVRTIAAALRPGVLDELGLVRALKSEAREFKRHTGIPCGFRTNVGQRDIRPCRRRRRVSDRPGGAHECGPARKGLAGQRCSREGKKGLDLDGP